MEKQRPKIVLLGSGGVGKSAMTLRFSDDKFLTEYDPTVMDEYQDKEVIVDGKKIILDILDTAGQEEYYSLQDNWIQQGHGFLIVYAVNDQLSIEEADVFFNKVENIRMSNDFAVVLCANKVDLQNDPTYDQKVPTIQGKTLAEKHNCPFLETSAKTGKNIEECFHELIRVMRRKKTIDDDSASSKPADEGGCCTIL